jgi:hydrogenase maturation factor HypE
MNIFQGEVIIMFICGITKKMSNPGEKVRRLVVQTRTKEYKNYDRETEENWSSFGTEIVKEVNATEEGEAMWNRLTPEQQVEVAKSL